MQGYVYEPRTRCEEVTAVSGFGLVYREVIGSSGQVCTLSCGTPLGPRPPDSEGTFILSGSIHYGTAAEGPRPAFRRDGASRVNKSLHIF